MNKIASSVERCDEELHSGNQASVEHRKGGVSSQLQITPPLEVKVEQTSKVEKSDEELQSRSGASVEVKVEEGTAKV